MPAAIPDLYCLPSRSPQDFKEPGSQSKQYFLGLEAVFGGSGNPAYPGGQASVHAHLAVVCSQGMQRA